MANSSVFSSTTEAVFNETDFSDDNFTSSFYFSSTTDESPTEFEISTGSKVGSVIAVLYLVVSILLSAYWLYTYWNHQDMRAYKDSINARAPKLMIISYIFIFCTLLQQSISILYFTFLDDPEIIYHNKIPIAIMLTKSTDTAFRIILYISFWTLFQLKIYRYFVHNTQ